MSQNKPSITFDADATLDNNVDLTIEEANAQLTEHPERMELCSVDQQCLKAQWKIAIPVS
jgi:hypothetical protein